MAVVKNPVTRNLLFFSGVLATLLGVIGAFLPLLPTTPFILLAAWCFLKSSPKAHAWLSRQPALGEALKNWEKDRSISKRSKIFAILTIAISLVIIWFQVNVFSLRIALTLLLTGISVFIATRNRPHE